MSTGQGRFRFHAPPSSGAQHLAADPAFSVIVAAFNAEETIAAALESALAQTTPPHEVIVVDDGSTDGTPELLAEWSPRITTLRTENRGPAAARNEAARIASGDFLVILDADDVFLPERLEALTALAVTRPDLDLLITNVVREEGSSSEILFGSRNRFPVDDQRRAILKGDFVQFPAVRAQTFAEHGGFDERFLVGEDWELWARMILAGSRVGFVDDPLLRYRRHPQSLTSDDERLLRGVIGVYRSLIAHPTLDDDELALVADGLSKRVALLDAVLTQRALARGSGDARSRALAISRSNAHPPRRRAKALVAAALPQQARRLLAGSVGEQPALDPFEDLPLEVPAIGAPRVDAEDRAEAAAP